MNETDEVLDFIKRRFPNDNDWLTGNCYYFAVILKNRFPEGTILYDIVAGHFVTMISGIKYDWSGIVANNNYSCYVAWDYFDEFDPVRKNTIIKGCIE